MRTLPLTAGLLALCGCPEKTAEPECDETVLYQDDAACFCSLHPTDAQCEACDSGCCGDTACDRPPPPPPAIKTLTMDMVIGWDNAAGQTTTMFNPFAGGDQFSYFALNLGPAGWSGDTSLPGPPSNWCFILWNMDGMTNDTSDPTWSLTLVGLDAADGVTNCGRESAPGAGDLVTFDGSFFQGEDPVAFMTPLNWTFHFGGELTQELIDYDVTGPWQGYGYVADNFWGSRIASDLIGGDGTVDTFTYGWVGDGAGSVQQDGNDDPVRFTRNDWVGTNGPKEGMYVHIVPWIFNFQ